MKNLMKQMIEVPKFHLTANFKAYPKTTFRIICNFFIFKFLFYYILTNENINLIIFEILAVYLVAALRLLPAISRMLSNTTIKNILSRCLKND